MVGMEGGQGLVVVLGEELLDNLLYPYVNARQGKTALKRIHVVVL